MKIAYITSASADSAGGDGRVARELAEAVVLARTGGNSVGHEVLLVLSGEKTGSTKTSENFTQFEVSGRKKGDIILPLLNPVKINALTKVLRKFDPDIIHFHDQGPVSFVALLWALKNRVPTVFTSHTIPSEVVSFGLAELFPKIEPLFDNKLFDGYLDLFLKKSSAIVAINDSVLQDLAQYLFDTPVFRIPNGRHLSHYTKVSFADIEASPLHLLFVGYLNKRKNQKYLLDVLRLLPKNFVLDLVGVPLNDNYEEELREKAEEHNLPVKFWGKVSHERIPEILEQSHFFVSASTMEVQSLAVLEALASGTPVVGLKNETTAEFIDNSVGRLLGAEASPPVFAQALEELSALSLEEYSAMCEESRKKVAHLDWSNIVEQTLCMYAEVIASAEVSPRRLNGLKKLLKFIDISV